MTSSAYRALPPVFTMLVVVACLAPTGALASTIIGPLGLPYQEWTDRSLVPTPPGTFTVVNEGCDPEPACTANGAPIYIDSGSYFDGSWDSPWGQLRRDFLHELGHHFDYAILGDSERASFQRLIEVSGPWRREGGGGAIEEFADAFALCALKRKLNPESAWIGPPGWGLYREPSQHREACRLIRRAYWY